MSIKVVLQATSASCLDRTFHLFLYVVSIWRWSTVNTTPWLASHRPKNVTEWWVTARCQRTKSDPSPLPSNSICCLKFNYLMTAQFQRIPGQDFCVLPVHYHEIRSSKPIRWDCRRGFSPCDCHMDLTWLSVYSISTNKIILHHKYVWFLQNAYPIVFTTINTLNWAKVHFSITDITGVTLFGKVIWCSAEVLASWKIATVDR